MAKLTRKTQKIFAGNADSDQITAFATAKTSSPVYTTDIDAIQTTAFTQGWTPSLMSDLAPYLQDSNGLWYAITRQLAYIYQQGIAEWDTNTTYYTGSLVMSGSNMYQSKVDDNLGHALTEATYWKLITISGEIGQPIIRLDNTLLDGEIRLEGATVSRTTYATLFAKYGTTYGAGDGSTTFKLPDFRDRTLWGSTTYGYIAAGLPNITGKIGGQPLDYTDSKNYPTSGAFYRVSDTSCDYSVETNTYKKHQNIAFDASKSSSIYSASSTVQPPSIKVRFVTKYI